MNRNSLVITAVMLLAALAAASSVEAHPAVPGTTATAGAGIDPNIFIVAHPAGLALVRGHANHEHPAVSAQRDARGLDPNQFIVQPPVSAHWALASEPAAQLAALR